MFTYDWEYKYKYQYLYRTLWFCDWSTVQDLTVQYIDVLHVHIINSWCEEVTRALKNVQRLIIKRLLSKCLVPSTEIRAVSSELRSALEWTRNHVAKCYRHCATVACHEACDRNVRLWAWSCDNNEVSPILGVLPQPSPRSQLYTFVPWTRKTTG